MEKVVEAAAAPTRAWEGRGRALPRATVELWKPFCERRAGGTQITSSGVCTARFLVKPVGAKAGSVQDNLREDLSDSDAAAAGAFLHAAF